MHSSSVNSLPRAHLWNQLRARHLMAQGASPLLIDNTNLQAWEAAPYVRAAAEFDYHVEIVEPRTLWANDPVQCAQRGAHGLREDALQRLAGKREDYSVKDAMRAAEREEQQLDEKERKKVEQMIERYFAPKTDPTTTATTTATPEKANVVIRIEISKNDGRKASPKPLLIKTATHSTLVDVARLACNALKLRIGVKGPRFFTLRGEEIGSLAELSSGMQVVFSENGQDYVPIALRKSAAERRVARAERALAAARDDGDGGEDEDNEEEDEERDDDKKDGGKEDASKNSKKKNLTKAEQEQAKAMHAAMRALGKLPKGASQVSPRIFVGSGRDAHSDTELRRYEITHILNAAGDFPSSRVDGIRAMRQLQLLDKADASLAPHLALAFEFIDAALQQEDARVLVHCVVGRSRSVSIVLAYLITRHRLPLREALQQVRAARPTAEPNVGFMRQLMALERRELQSCSLGWEEIVRDGGSVLEWLRENDEPKRATATHMWAEPNSKITFRIPPQRRDELLARVARAVSSDANVHLALIELPDPAASRFHGKWSKSLVSYCSHHEISISGRRLFLCCSITTRL